jgi:TRAP-type C4-dicarboxylate transport system permease small subunit
VSRPADAPPERVRRAAVDAAVDAAEDAAGLTPVASVDAHAIDPDIPRLLMPLARVLGALNRAMVALGMLALVAASLVLTSSVVTRYLWKASTDWQDETAVFLLVGTTFGCGAFVQAIRGHVGIEALATVLPRLADAWRRVLVDAMCLAFCALFAWKSWTLWHEAWAEHQTTDSSWAPPLWIPYLLMATGMTLLTLQLLVQLTATLRRARRRRAQGAAETAR